MTEYSDAPSWFYVCAFGSAATLALVSVAMFRKKRTRHGLQQVHASASWLRITHYAMCLSFVTSTVALATLKITCNLRHAFYQPVIEALLQVLMVFEVQSILAESISNMQLCRSISKLSKLVLFSNMAALIAPMAFALFTTAYELASTNGSEVFTIAPPFDHTYITHNVSETPQTFKSSENSTKPPDYSTIRVYKHPDDPLLLLEPIFAPNAQNREFGQKEKQTELQKQIEMISEQTGTTVGLYERILMIRYLEEVEEFESSFVCWMTWPSSGLLVTYVIVTLSCFYGYALALKELRYLRNTSTAKAVPLESWLACVVRPTVITVTLLKWIAVSLEWHSFHCLYTVCLAMCLVPCLYPFLIGPGRCPRSGRMRRGLLSKRFEKLSYRGLQTATNCRRRNIGSFSVGFNLENARAGISETQRYKMLQLEETRSTHVTGGNVIINQTLSDFVRDRDVTKDHGVYDADPRDLKFDDVKLKVSNTESEDEGYGVIKARDYDVVDVAADLAKCKMEANRASVFDDSDYDEVMDFMTSPTSSTCEETKVIEQDPNSEPNTTDDCPNLDQSSKRSSGASQVESLASSGTLSSSGVESSDEKPNPKYASLDIAKILHTRKRIQRILHTPQASEVNSYPTEDEQPTTNTVMTKKKSSSVYKRHTHYGTLGRRKASSKRASSIPRPLSGSENDYPDGATYQPGDYSTFDPLRARKGVAASSENYFTFDRPKSRGSDSDGNSDTNRNSGGFEGGSKRWSRLSSNSQNSDKATSISPQKGPFKAFRRFVYSTSSSNMNSTGPLSHEEKKAMIQICVGDANSNNNNSSVHPSVEDIMSRGEYAMQRDAKKNSYNCIPVGSVDATGEYTFSPVADNAPRRDTHSLLRKLSKKSSPARGRDPRRSSLPSQSMYDVRSTSQPPVNDVTPPRFQYGDGSQQKSDIESRVMESVERNDRSKSEGKSLQKSGSLRRLFSFAKRRPSVKKSPVKRRDTEPASTMNKSLSYSSPQLSVFAVNSPGTSSSRAGLAQKLVF